MKKMLVVRVEPELEVYRTMETSRYVKTPTATNVIAGGR